MFYSLFPLAGTKLQRIIHPGLQDFYVKRITTLCGLNRDHVKFPGANPVSMMRRDLEEIRNSQKSIPWMVTEKSDGLRLLLVLTMSPQCEPVALLVDRSYGIYILPGILFLPHIFVLGTIIDTELILEKPIAEEMASLGTRPTLWLLLCFDLLVLAGENCCRAPFVQRHEMLSSLLDACYKPQIGVDVCILRLKIFYPLSELKHLCEDIIPELHHENDGLIIMKGNSTYKAGMQKTTLKWKEKSKHSVDFLCHLHKIVESQKQWMFGIYVNDVAGKAVLANYILISESDLQRLGLRNFYELELSIVECFWSDETGWRPERLRHDKKEANYENTLRKTVDNISENITLQELMQVKPEPSAQVLCPTDDEEEFELLEEVFGN